MGSKLRRSVMVLMCGFVLQPSEKRWRNLLDIIQIRVRRLFGRIEMLSNLFQRRRHYWPRFYKDILKIPSQLLVIYIHDRHATNNWRLSFTGWWSKPSRFRRGQSGESARPRFGSIVDVGDASIIVEQVSLRSDRFGDLKETRCHQILLVRVVHFACLDCEISSKLSS